MRVGALVTVSATATVWGLLPAPAAATVTVPLCVPAANPPGFTETLRLPGVVPLRGETLSQFPPELVDAEAVNESAPPLLDTDAVWAAGAADPI